MSENFPMNNIEIPDKLEECVEAIWKDPGAWRSYIIAFDGRPGAGKSVAGRYTSHRLNMPILERDLFLKGNGTFKYKESLKDILTTRLDLNRPLIIEGVFAARLLFELDFKADFLVRIVANNDNINDISKEYATYEIEFTPNEIVEFHNPFHERA